MITTPRVKFFTVHVRADSDGSNVYEDTEFVEEGFSLFAFILGPLWALYHRLWLVAAVLISIKICIAGAQYVMELSPFQILPFNLTLSLAFGLFANDLRVWKLKRNGYVLTDVVTGETLLRAQQRFFDRFLSVRPAIA